MKKSILFIFLLSYFGLKAQSEHHNELSLIFIGDFMGHKDQIDAAYNSITKTYDYDNCFRLMKKSLSDADITIGNLEVTLGNKKPFSGYPNFKSPASYAAAIKKAGVDVLVTSNNHSCDKGKKGLENTIKILDSLQIKHTGTFISEEQKQKKNPLILHKNGFTIALLNYTYGTNGLEPTSPNIVNYLDEKTILSDLKKVKEAAVDEVIVFVHWGLQYKNLPNKEQHKWYRFFKENGVRIIIGAHPHVVQPIVHHILDDSLVAYSLGNFVSHQRTFPRDGGAILKINLVKYKEKVFLNDASYKLTWVYEPVVNGKKHYYVLPVSEYEHNPGFFKQRKDYDKMMRYVKHARNLLKTHNVNVLEYK